MFLRTPDDIRNINVGAGQCYNSSVPQNITFGYQNVPFSEDGNDTDENGADINRGFASSSVMAIAILTTLFVFAS